MDTLGVGMATRWLSKGAKYLAPSIVTGVSDKRAANKSTMQQELLSGWGPREFAALTSEAVAGREEETCRIGVVRHGMGYHNDAGVTGVNHSFANRDAVLNEVGVDQARMLRKGLFTTTAEDDAETGTANRNGGDNGEEDDDAAAAAAADEVVESFLSADDRLGSVVKPLSADRVGLIVVSPFRRALQTAIGVLGEEWIAANRDKVYVTPLAAEHTLFRSHVQQGDRGTLASCLRDDPAFNCFDFSGIDAYCDDLEISSGKWWCHSSTDAYETNESFAQRACRFRQWLATVVAGRELSRPGSDKVCLIFSHGGLASASFGGPAYGNCELRVFDLYRDGSFKRAARGCDDGGVEGGTEGTAASTADTVARSVCDEASRLSLTGNELDGSFVNTSDTAAACQKSDSGSGNDNLPDVGNSPNDGVTSPSVPPTAPNDARPSTPPGNTPTPSPQRTGGALMGATSRYVATPSPTNSDGIVEVLSPRDRILSLADRGADDVSADDDEQAKPSLAKVAVIDSAACEIETDVLHGFAKVVALGAKRLEDLGDLSEYRAVFLWHTITANAALLQRLTNCTHLIRLGAGFDNVDVAAAGQLGIAISNVPNYGTEEVADSALSHILNLYRKTHQMAVAVEAGKMYPAPEDITRGAAGSRRIRGQTLGIVGLGRIGTAVALRAKPFGFNIHFYDPKVPAGYDKAIGIIRAETLAHLLEVSDCVTLHCDLNPSSARLINKTSLAFFKPGSFLINTARGALIDEEALAHALAIGRVEAAALDVHEKEPFNPANSPLGPHCATGRVISTPHSAFYSDQSVVEMRRLGAEEVRRGLQGRPLSCCVNKTFLSKQKTP